MLLKLSQCLLLALLLVACAPIAKGPKQDPLSQASAVSVALPEFVTTPETTLHWRSDLRWLDDPQGRYKRRAEVLQQGLQKEFERKGYRFVPSSDAATYDVVAIALLGTLQEQEKLESVFRLYPSLAKPAKGYGVGTVLVAIAPAGTSDIVWRGALEVFTYPGHLPVEQRYERLEWAASKLLASIPTLPAAAPQ